MVPGFVLVSSKACDVAHSYDSAWTSPAALPDDHSEHPTKATWHELIADIYTSKFFTSRACV